MSWRRKIPRIYLPEVAITLNNLGIFDSAQNRIEEARKEFAEALQIRRELARKNPEAYSPKAAETLNNLGLVDSAQNRMEEAASRNTRRRCRFAASWRRKIRRPICLT